MKIDGRVNEGLFAELLQQIDRAKQGRVRRFLRWEDRQRSLFADLLLRTMLVRAKGLRNANINLHELPNGKPVLLHAPGVHFNLSHSGHWMACIVDDKEVGIDVEQVSDTDLSLSDRFFSRGEHEQIMQAADPVDRFFDYWTLKESYIKFTGAGLSQPLNTFSIQFLGGAEVRVAAGGDLLPGVYFKQYEVEQGYKFAACAAHAGFPAKCEVFTLEAMADALSIRC